MLIDGKRYQLKYTLHLRLILSVLLMTVLLSVSGCSTQPLSKVQFPEPPALLMAPPDKLVDLPDTKLELSTIVKTSVTNNAISYKNSTQLESLQTWIRIQLELFK